MLDKVKIYIYNVHSRLNIRRWAMKQKRKDTAGGIAKQMAAQYRNGGAHKERRPSKKRCGGKERRQLLSFD